MDCAERLREDLAHAPARRARRPWCMESARRPRGGQASRRAVTSRKAFDGVTMRRRSQRAERSSSAVNSRLRSATPGRYGAFSRSAATRAMCAASYPQRYARYFHGAQAQRRAQLPAPTMPTCQSSRRSLPAGFFSPMRSSVRRESDIRACRFHEQRGGDGSKFPTRARCPTNAPATRHQDHHDDRQCGAATSDASEQREIFSTSAQIRG